MANDRIAAVRAVLAWLATLPHGLAWAERWRAEYAAELAALGESTAGGNIAIPTVPRP